MEHLYTKKQLRDLLIPLIVEQVLLSLMGTVDTIMVSNVGDYAVSGVSLVDSINKLLIYLFASIATGGVILCSQYLGYGNQKKANEAGGQVLMAAFFLAVIIMGLVIVFRNGILSLIFGTVEESVMQASRTYLLITAISYPFISVFNACSAIYRATGNSRLPMLVSAASNALNIAGNAVLIFGFGMGVTGAAISTTGSVIFVGIVMLYFMRRPGLKIEIGKLTKLRPDLKQMLWVLKIGIPTGVENSMFQLGKLAVQSTVSTLGTAAIASNAIVTALELMSSTPSMGIYIALITVAGTCIGAGRVDEAKYYIKRFTALGAIVLLIVTWGIYALTLPISRMAGLTGETLEMTLQIMLMISILKPFLWPLAFVPSNGMRAAGDGTFSMIVSTLSMWIVRVGISTILCRFMGVGLIGIWIGYELDWAVRSVANVLRFRSGKWTKHQVMQVEK